MHPPVERSQWFKPFYLRAGSWAFLLHRVSGLGLVAYLYLHLVLLNQLRGGPEKWEAFLAFARSPIALTLDTVLLAALSFHTLNGLRLTLLGFGYGLSWQKRLFWISFILSLGLSGLFSVYRFH